jgi:hypothetical protein
MVTRAQFWTALRAGDMVFCEGMTRIIDAGIKLETGSCLTHVLSVWLDGSVWTTVEATIQRGVHCSQFSDYVDGYNGNLVIARRPILTPADLRAERDAMLALLDEAYDWQQEATIVAHNLIKALPVLTTRKECYCSGLMYQGSLSSGAPLAASNVQGEMPTPEDIWLDPSVAPICALMRGTKTQ